MILSRIKAAFLNFWPSHFIYLLSILFICIIPAMLPLVRRALTPALVIVGFAFAVVLILEKRLLRHFSEFLKSPTIILCLVFLAWSIATWAWTPLPERGLVSLLTATALPFFAICVHAKMPSSMSVWLAVGLAFGGLVMIADALSGYPLASRIYIRLVGEGYNQAYVSYAILIWSLVDKPVHIQGKLFSFTILIVVTSIFLGQSETAKLGLLIGAFGYLVAVVLTRRAVVTVAALLSLVVWLCIFWLPDLFMELLDLNSSFWRAAHAAERLEIWTAYVDYARTGLPYGWGVEATAATHLTAYSTRVVGSLIVDPLGWHPHNNILQIIAELGLIGQLLGCLITVSLFLTLPKAEHLFAKTFAFWCCVYTIGFVGHGFWQSWWWSAVLLGILMLNTKKEPAR